MRGRGSGRVTYFPRSPDGSTSLRNLLFRAGAVAVLAAGCSNGASTPATYELPSSEAEQYATAYIASVVADAPGDDLEPGAGEHVVVVNNWDLRADLGGWRVEDADGNRLPLGTGRQIEPGGELSVHTSCGEDTETEVFACLDTAVLDDDGDVVRLLDSSGAEVMRFAYGTATDR